MQKQYHSLWRTRKFQKRSNKKVHNLQDKTLCKKYNVSVTAIAKLVSSNFSILISTKFKIQTYQKPAIKIFKNLALPIFWSSFQCFGNYAFNITYFLCVFCLYDLYVYLHGKKKQSGTCLFVDKIPLIEQSRGLIG